VVPPASTYRVQLHPGFGLAAAAEVVPYLGRLGASHLYCSPYLQAAPGSLHGYDVVDPHRINTELGGEPAHALLTAALVEHGLGHVLDIVPNHMATAGRANPWWWDVLGSGRSSWYASYFDIDWQGADASEAGTILVPILGDHYGRAVDRGELQVAWDGRSFVVRYYEQELPLAAETLDVVLLPMAHQLTSAGAELEALAGAFAAVPAVDRNQPISFGERRALVDQLLDALGTFFEEEPERREVRDRTLEVLNRDPDRLDHLLRRQHYRLAYWRTASEEIDYRRFFNIDSLIGVRVEVESVFDDTHRLILDLVAAGVVDGLRVDHVDGLRDPAGYLRRLRDASQGTYVTVEKILGARESLPATWPVAGTTGYDFLHRVDRVLVDAAGEADLTRCYEEFTGATDSYPEIEEAAKRQVLAEELAAEVDRLHRILIVAADDDRHQRDRTRRELRDALVELLVAFPVYRGYGQPGQTPSDADRVNTAAAVARAGSSRPDIDPGLLSWLGQLLLLEQAGWAGEAFALRFAQVSAPVMAKGVEDTAFYRYHRLISLNEVGGHPDQFGGDTEEFHQTTAAAARAWPEAMLTLSTHDTKRSADVRARIHLLSQIPQQWQQAVERFAELTRPYRHEPWPDRNAEYLLYQSLVGAWPISIERATAFMAKATKEAKVHTSWLDPQPGYDDSMAAFVKDILSDPRFVDELERFLAEQRLIERGRINALVQTTLLLTCPGVADIYQGNELWDLSLVDPDNRRPVDYALRTKLLAQIGPQPPVVSLSADDVGAWKLWLTNRLLLDRGQGGQRRDRYVNAEYEPLEVSGPAADRVIAYRRPDRVVVVPRLPGPPAETWAGTAVALGGGTWVDVLTGQSIGGVQAAVGEIWSRAPVAVLALERS
jgi:(1->4)-alpha-D-glucan 1-alpha-D-glucosylmutase